MVLSNLSIRELLNYADPKTDLEIALFNALKEAQEEIMDLQDSMPSCGPQEL